MPGIMEEIFFKGILKMFGQLRAFIILQECHISLKGTSLSTDCNLGFKECLENSEKGQIKSSSGKVRENLKIWHLSLEVKQNILIIFKG